MQKKLDLTEYLNQYITKHSGVAVKTAVTIYPDQLAILRTIASERRVSVARVIRGLIDFALSQQSEKQA